MARSDVRSGESLSNLVEGDADVVSPATQQRHQFWLFSIASKDDDALPLSSHEPGLKVCRSARWQYQHASIGSSHPREIRGEACQCNRMAQRATVFISRPRLPVLIDLRPCESRTERGVAEVVDSMAILAESAYHLWLNVVSPRRRDVNAAHAPPSSRMRSNAITR